MSRNNTIGIVGDITAPIRMIVDAGDWKQRVYETTLTRTRPSGTEDTFILQFAAHAAGTEAMLEQIAEGVSVLIGGEIRTENVHNPQPEENRVKVYIHAEVIAVNMPPAFAQKAEGLRIINRALNEIGVTASRDTVIAQTGIATGYANAMQHFKMMSESELKDVIAVIGQTGERALSRIEKSERYGIRSRKKERV